MIRRHSLHMYAPIAFALLWTSCAIDGSDVVSGGEVIDRIRTAVSIKVGICYPGDASNVLLAKEVTTRFDRGQFYSTKDVDRCIQDFDALPCAFFYQNFGRQSVSLFVGNVYAFVCPNLSDKEFFSPTYMQGNFPESSSTKHSSTSSN